MRPPHAELRRRGFSGHRTGRSIVLLACIGVALALGAVARSAGGPTPSFAAAKSYATGKGPISVAVADLNGDGRRDMVTTNIYARTGSVLLNKGRGAFGARRDYATGHDPSEVVVSDVNGDGGRDLLNTDEVGHSWIVSVRLNRLDGSFAARRDYRTTGGAMTVADVNGDRRPDIVTA